MTPDSPRSATRSESDVFARMETEYPGRFSAMTAVGATASWLKAVFFADNVVLHGFFFYVGKWAFDIVYVTAERRMHGVELATQLLLWSPLSAALTALTGVILLLMLRPVLEPQAV